MSSPPADETLGQMRMKYGAFLDSTQMLKLDPANVPPALVAYIPYAALWGIADDLEREQLVARAPAPAKTDLTQVIGRIDDLLDDWLADTNVVALHPSDEYVAFSAMRMAADFL